MGRTHGPAPCQTVVAWPCDERHGIKTERRSISRLGDGLLFLNQNAAAADAVPRGLHGRLDCGNPDLAVTAVELVFLAFRQGMALDLRPSLPFHYPFLIFWYPRSLMAILGSLRMFLPVLLHPAGLIGLRFRPTT